MNYGNLNDIIDTAKATIGLGDPMVRSKVMAANGIYEEESVDFIGAGFMLGVIGEERRVMGKKIRTSLVRKRRSK